MKMTLFALLLAAGAVPASAETLSFDVAFNDQLLLANADALSPGDRILINDRLLSEGKEVGSAAGLCTIVDTATGAAICTVTFTLLDGTLAVQFVNAPPPEKHFPILGGTGVFEGATGTGTLVEYGDETGRVTFVIK